MLKTLLLNSNFCPISFISDKKVFKQISKDIIEVLSTWDEEVKWGRDGCNSCKHPAVVKLKHLAPWIPRKRRFNRYNVFKRDKYTCQYCGLLLSAKKATIEHVVPTAQGGESSWRNCVTSCFYCGNKKGNNTPDQANMKLLKKPIIPFISVTDDYFLIDHRHKEWGYYLNIDPKNL